MRVGVGVGAVMLGGCDVVSEAKARVFGDEPSEEVAVAAEAEAPVAVSEAPAAPEPLLLSRGGIAGVVQDISRDQTTPELAAPPPVRDLGRTFAERERDPAGSHAFVPYEGPAGAIAVAPEPIRAAAPSKPRPRPKRKAARPDEPCDPSFVAVEAAPDSGWQCPACGRG